MLGNGRHNNQSQPYKSTYNDAFMLGDTFRPRIRFFELPSIARTDPKALAPRQFPVEPAGPGRPLDNTRPIGPGLGTTDLRTDK